ncbi:ABC transporter substrate-binding protein [Roseococcus sp. DSY-14]|uniref:ABC transporter substrate-binding protein n=1 Tax=Roseococcus sp. DSY-14 TaxID=3369650 RepID=UPI00387AD32D
MTQPTTSRRALLGAAAALPLAAPAIAQAAPIRVGLVVVLTGPQASLGTQMRDGWALGMRHLNNQFGGRAVETIVIDDELRPDVAVTKVRAALERDRVDVVAGVVFSNILAAIMRPVTEANTFLISANAGPSTFAGRGCSPFFFCASYNNDQVHAATGQAAQDAGHRRVFLLTPNYQAGRDAFAGFKSRFRGEVVDEVFVPLTQLDFSAELARIASLRPDAVFTFMPGGLGVNLVRQYRQAGLANIPFLSSFTVDESTLPAQGEAALGFQSGTNWTPDLPNEPNRRFVEDFVREFSYVPASYAAHAYDTARLLDSAVRRVAGNLGDKNAMRAALAAAEFQSLRGAFRFGANQFPVQDFYLARVGRRPDGRFQTEMQRRVMEANVDPWAGECRMPARI